VSGAVDAGLRVLLTAAHTLLKAGWLVRRPKTFGAHAIALTPGEKIILVKLRYARGWRIPGGGRAADEDRVEAALRELREEIGMVSHGEVELARDIEERTDFKRDTVTLAIVRNVRYRPAAFSWEIEQVRECELGSLPADLSPRTANWIEVLRPLL